MKRKIGILLINIGSPASYEVKDVKPYLKKFLMDKEVITLPFILRWILVNLIIVPRRAVTSAAKYKLVWLPEGSPLTVYSEKFRKEMENVLGSEYVVETGMSNSFPSIEDALLKLVKQNVAKILFVPMYPQDAMATTGSAKNELLRLEKKHGLQIPFYFLPPFYSDAPFLRNSVRVAREFLKGKTVDHYLFSYHGLPESHILKNPGCEITDKCCVQQTSRLKGCYRAQCLQTSRLLARDLDIPDEKWSYSFQSRLGRAKWLGPATDQHLKELGNRGIKNVAVFCPSFVADCIETIEEIGLEGTQTFTDAGGEKLHLIPCLNDDSQWARDFAQHCRQSLESYGV